MLVAQECALNDFEVIVIDDGSNDGTGIKIAELSDKYKNLVSVTHETNQGLGAAIRSGIEVMTFTPNWSNFFFRAEGKCFRSGARVAPQVHEEADARNQKQEVTLLTLLRNFESEGVKLLKLEDNFAVRLANIFKKDM